MTTPAAETPALYQLWKPRGLSSKARPGKETGGNCDRSEAARGSGLPAGFVTVSRPRAIHSQPGLFVPASEPVLDPAPASERPKQSSSVLVRDSGKG